MIRYLIKEEIPITDQQTTFTLKLYSPLTGELETRATAYGDLYVHFWQSEGFFIGTKQELTRSLQKHRRDER